MSHRIIKGTGLVLSLILAFAFGILAFASALALLPSLLFAGIAFFATAAIIATVYRENIEEALNRIFDKKFIRKRLLEDLIKNNATLKAKFETQLEQDTLWAEKKARMATITIKLALLYKAKKQNQSDQKHKEIDRGIKIFKTEYKECQQQMAQQRKALLATWYGEAFENKFLGNLSTQEIDDLQHAYRRSQYILIGSSLLSVLAGVSFYFVTLAGFSAAGITLTEAVGGTAFFAAMATPLTAVAALAGIAYFLAISATINRMMGDSRVQDWKKRTFNYLYDDKLSNAERRRRKIAVGIILALIILATALTAGGWYHAAVEGAKLMPHIKSFSAQIISAATAPFYLIGFMCFCLWNARTLISMMTKKSLWTRIQEQHVFLFLNNWQYKNDNGWIQAQNPIRLLLKAIVTPFKVIAFLFHSATEAMALVQESNSKIMAMLGLFIVSTNDTVVEGSALLDQEDEEEEEHSHGLFDLATNTIIILVALPFHPLIAAWRCAGERLFYPKEKRVGFWQALKKSWQEFHGHNHDQVEAAKEEVKNTDLEKILSESCVNLKPKRSWLSRCTRAGIAGAGNLK